MKTFIHRTSFAVIAAALCLMPAAHLFAATLYLAPSSSQVGHGQTFTVDVKVDSAGVGFNAAQATINFPASLLQVSADKSNSSFNFWLEEPTVSNTQGSIEFIGGTPYGISGSAIQVLRLVFTPKGTGTGAITIANGAVTASDGSGTNILSTMSDATIVISPTRVSAAKANMPSPALITRTAVAAQNVPAKPNLQVPLYPTDTQWYNQMSAFVASWDLPSYITGVSTVLNKQPNFNPATTEGLFDSKSFGALADGVSYLHVRFKNNIGWGTAVHRRIAIDTQPPLGFKIATPDGDTTDNPTPTLQFKTSDALSGLKEYQIQIDTGDVISIPAADFSGSYAPQPLLPGDHRVLVRAVDQAGNSVEDFVVIHILPIAPPSISFLQNKLSLDQKSISLRGTAIPGATVLLVMHQDGAEIARASALADINGVWEKTFVQTLQNGIYQVSAQTQDRRGALSLVVESPAVTVRPDVVMFIGPFALGWFELSVIGVCLALMVMIIILLRVMSRRNRREAHRAIAGKDVAAMSTVLEDDIQNLESDWRNIKQKLSDGLHMSARVAVVHGAVAKLKKYVGREVG